MNNKSLFERGRFIRKAVTSQNWLTAPLNEEEEQEQQPSQIQRMSAAYERNKPVIDSGRGLPSPNQPPRRQPPRRQPPNPRATARSVRRERDLGRTSLLTPDSGEGKVSLHNAGSSVNAAKLNENIDRRNKLREQYERDLRVVDRDDNKISDESKIMKQALNELLMEIGDGKTKEQLRDRFITIAARAQTTPRKIRAGKGARSILAEDREALLDPHTRSTLEDGFGDGSWAQVKIFGDGMKILKDSLEDSEWDEVAKRWYGSQGGNIRKVFDGAGNLGSKNNGSNNHFAGFNENGEKIAGKANNMARTLALVKVYLQQAGLDGYTQTPLSFNHMEPDHIRGYQTKVGGLGPTAEDRFLTDHPDNWIWTHTGINNIKSDQTIPDFLQGLEDMPQKKIDSLMSDEQLNLQDEGGRFLEDDTTDFARSFLTQHSDDQGTVNILSDALTPEMIKEREEQQLSVIRELQDQGLQIDESRLLKDVFAAGGAIPAQQRLNLPSQNKEKVRERSQARIGDNAIREMFSVMAGKSPEEQARISRAWKASWDESLETIDRNFKIYDEARQNQDEQVVYDNDDLILKDSEDEDFLGRQVVRGGPSLRKLFALAMRAKLGAEGGRIADQINVREWITPGVDSRLFL